MLGSGVPIHRLIVYLPLVLSAAALASDAWGMSSGEWRYHGMGSRLSKWAAFSAVLAVATGFSLAGATGMGSRGNVAGHAGLGAAATIVLAALAVVRYTAENRADAPEEIYKGLWLAVEGLGAALIAVAAIIGFKM